MTDIAYDVTMALRRDFHLATGETGQFTTITTFGMNNEPPTAVSDNAGTVAEDGTLTIPASVLTANDNSGPAYESWQTLTVTGVAATADTHGTVQLVGGNVIYKPAPNYNGPASFTYTVQDNGLPEARSAVGTVSLMVTEVNDKPVTSIDYPITAEDTPMVINADLLTRNDTPGPANEADQILKVTDVRAVSDTHGTLSVTRDAEGNVVDIIYTPAENYHGPARFQYKVRDNGTTNSTSDPGGLGLGLYDGHGSERRADRQSR